MRKEKEPDLFLLTGLHLFVLRALGQYSHQQSLMQ